MSQHLSFTMFGKALLRIPAKVRTGLGKTDRPGSQGGLWKRGCDGSRTEAHRETDGTATGP
jgi:hypothetical protein